MKFLSLPVIRQFENMRVQLLRGTVVVVMATAMACGARAQYAWDIGGSLGGANYLGEFGGINSTDNRRDFVWDTQLSQTRWDIGVFARRRITRMISVNAGLSYYRLQGADYLSSNLSRLGRNLSFRNDMFELYARPEFTLYQDNDFGGRGRYRTGFRLYAYAGAALYYSNPKGQIDHTGDFYALRDMHTELHNYSNLGFSIPTGIGMYFTVMRRHRIGWDFGWRTTFSDYIDDASTKYVDPNLLPGGATGLAAQLADQSQYVADPNNNIPDPVQYGPGSPRGNSSHNDSYMIMSFSYSYVLRGQSNFYRSQYSWMRGKKRVGRKSRAKF